MKAKGKVGSGTKMLDCFRGTVGERHLKADSNSVSLWFSSVCKAHCAHPLPAFSSGVILTWAHPASQWNPPQITGYP